MKIEAISSLANGGKKTIMDHFPSTAAGLEFNFRSNQVIQRRVFFSIFRQKCNEVTQNDKGTSYATSYRCGQLINQLSKRRFIKSQKINQERAAQQLSSRAAKN